MARGYQPILDGDGDSRVDDDTVELFMGQSGSGYVVLDDLDDEGHASHELSASQRLKQEKLLRATPQRLMWVVSGTIAFLLIIGMAVSWKNRFSASMPRRKLIGVSNGTHTFNVSTIAISLDGFHPHYVNSERSPHLDRLVREQCAVPWMQPSFPTQTFPNHWTLVTGLEPMHHGIVGNTFMDPELGQFVNTDRSRSMNPEFWGGEPVWVTAGLQGKRVAVHMWPGSEVDWEEGTPDYVSKFNSSEPLDTKAEKLVSWLDDPSTMPALMLAYVPTVDVAGHQHGISGDEVVRAIGEVDTLIGKLTSALEERNLTEIVNLVVVSDHGMAPTADSRIFFMDDIVPPANLSSRQGWPLAGLRLTPETDPNAIWKDINRPFKGIKSYKKTEFPASFHFRATGRYQHRFAPFYLVPDLGWSIVTHEDWDNMGHTYNLQGVHGYDNSEPLMRAFFVAQGPAFPPGAYEPVRSIDVYSGLCWSIGVKPSNNDGHFSLRRITEPIKEVYPGGKFGMDFLPNSTFETFDPRQG